MVNNASTQPMSGTVDVDLIDPETEQSRLHDFGLTERDVKALPFEMNGGQSANLKIALKAPSDPGVVHVKVTASTPNSPMESCELYQFYLAECTSHSPSSSSSRIRKPKPLRFPIWLTPRIGPVLTRAWWSRWMDSFFTVLCPLFRT